MACEPSADAIDGAPGEACDVDNACADGQPCRDGICEGCGDARVQPGELCFGEPIVLETLGANELHVLRGPLGPSLFATVPNDPRLRRLHGAEGPTLVEEWFLLENVPFSSIVGDFDDDGWDDALVWTTFPVGAIAASFDTGVLRLGWFLVSERPDAYMAGSDGEPGRFFQNRGDELAVWTAVEPSPTAAAPIAIAAHAIAVCEIDGDGRPDLILATAGRLDWMSQNGSDFAPRGGGPIGFDADRFVCGDLDADGRLEIVASRQYGVGLAIVRAADDGALELVWSDADASTSELALADLDHDGRDDLLGAETGADSLRVVSFTPDGMWLEREMAVPGDTNVARPFDVDDDGLVDVVVGQRDRLVILPGRG